MEEKLAEFGQRYPDYEFKHLFYEVEELRTNYIISAYAGKGPALIHCASDNVGPLAELELIRPLESFFQQTTLDSFMSDPFRANTVLDGHLYQIADRVGNHLALVYNKKFVPEPPRTMSELIAMGQKLTQPHDGQPPAVRYALAWNFIEPYFAMPFIGGYGGWVFDENNQPSLDNQATVRAARLIYDMANKYKIIPKESDYETANALFLDEQSAMIINGPWSWATYTTSGLDVGLAKIPMIDETGIWPAPMVSPMGYMVNINLTGEKEQITLELLHFLT
ncbi:MAG: extracellular solute-binding protein, partial [Calditrichaeota bacterium]|nr:extracellular solute-binding protein [Calditrichota bacterium]